jgi:polyferredoxin
MDKMGYPAGLIRYTTEHALSGTKTRVLRPRLFVYATMLLVLIGGVLWSISHRVPLRAELIRDRNALYRELPDGRIENSYTLKLINMDNAVHRYRIGTARGEDIVIAVEPDPVLAGGQVGTFSVRLRAHRQAGHGPQDVEIHFQAEDDANIRIDRTTTMILPFAE